jgi:hypothetical protein
MIFMKVVNVVRLDFVSLLLVGLSIEKMLYGLAYPYLPYETSLP